MKTTRLAELDVRITGGTDGDGGGSGPVVVLLHGFGAPGDDLVPLWRGLAVRPARTLRYVFPEAPLALGPGFGGGARAWWWIDLEARMRRAAAGGVAWDIEEVPEGLASAREKVSALLGEVLRVLRPATKGDVILGGFSQGAMLSLDVALRTQHELAGLVLMSGTHIAAREWAGHLGQRAGLPVFQSHGRHDPLLPFATAEGLRNTLTKGGMVVEWVPFEGGHGIPPIVMDGVGGFLSRVVAKGGGG
jgi:phospholipase/carboxylesterase